MTGRQKRTALYNRVDRLSVRDGRPFSNLNDDSLYRPKPERHPDQVADAHRPTVWYRICVSAGSVRVGEIDCDVRVHAYALALSACYCVGKFTNGLPQAADSGIGMPLGRSCANGYRRSLMRAFRPVSPRR